MNNFNGINSAEIKEGPPVVETVRGALFHRGRFLVLQKDANSKNPVAIEFAGGKIDEILNGDSTLEEQKKALNNEVSQETGIDITNLSSDKIDDYEIFFEAIDKNNIKKQYKRLVHLFLTNIPDTQEVSVRVNETKNENGGSEDNHAGYRWISPDELINSTTILKENDLTGENTYPLSRSSRHIKKILEKVGVIAVNTRENKNDFVILTKNKLSKSVDVFINENQEYSKEQKENLKKRFKEALDLALEVHKDQKPRPDGPYVNHILRVSNRIVDEYGIKDPELVIAALLHDSVEDQAEKLAQLITSAEITSERQRALLFIKNTFGERVEKIVSKLSNPETVTEGLSSVEKNEIYKEHVKEAIEDSDVLPIKLSDFSDNALNLESVGDQARRLKLSKKYLPVMEVFIERIERAQDILNPEKISEMKNRLLSAIEDTKVFIQSQENI